MSLGRLSELTADAISSNQLAVIGTALFTIYHLEIRLCTNSMVDMQSGNCYKIKLLTSLLEIEHEWLHVDILAGETHSDEFKKMNPDTRIPVLVLNDGRTLTESNAILNFLADGSELLPLDQLLRAQVLQWRVFEQYNHEP